MGGQQSQETNVANETSESVDVEVASEASGSPETKTISAGSSQRFSTSGDTVIVKVKRSQDPENDVAVRAVPNKNNVIVRNSGTSILLYKTLPGSKVEVDTNDATNRVFGI